MPTSVLTQIQRLGNHDQDKALRQLRSYINMQSRRLGKIPKETEEWFQTNSALERANEILGSLLPNVSEGKPGKEQEPR